MSGAADPFADIHVLSRFVESRMLVSMLKEVLKASNLNTTGNKRPLIDRILGQLVMYRNTGNVHGYLALRALIDRYRQPPRPTHSDAAARPQGQMVNAQPGYAHPGTTNAAAAHWQSGHKGAPANKQALSLNFRPSPFYNWIEKCSDTAICPPAPRNTVTLTFMLTTAQLQILEQSGHAVMVFCAEVQPAYNTRPLLIEFPSPSELLVNGKKVIANLRGLKGKPGTAPPADITKLLALSPRVSNRLEITYQGTTRRFSLQAAVVKKVSVATLVERIRKGRFLTKESVLAKLRAPDDDDIEMSSFDLTLKDPLAYTRISLPCRSVSCRHNQCFDCEVFLMSNEQTPTWTCPICNIPINDEGSIVVDGYFQDILFKVDAEVDTILVDPQGNWRIPADKTANNDDDGDDSPLASAESNGVKPDVFDLDGVSLRAPSAVPAHVTDIITSRSVSPLSANTIKRKAPAAEVIDLTSDTDEETVPPAPPPKKTQLVLPKPVSARSQNKLPNPFERAAAAAAQRAGRDLAASSVSVAATPYPMPAPPVAPASVTSNGNNGTVRDGEALPSVAPAASSATHSPSTEHTSAAASGQPPNDSGIRGNAQPSPCPPDHGASSAPVSSTAGPSDQHDLSDVQSTTPIADAPVPSQSTNLDQEDFDALFTDDIDLDSDTF